MTVWVVMSTNNREPHGVFSTYEKAQYYISEHPKRFVIEEYKVDSTKGPW